MSDQVDGSVFAARALGHRGGQDPRPVAERRRRRRGHVFEDRFHPGTSETMLETCAKVLEIVVSGEMSEAEHPGHEVHAMDDARHQPGFPGTGTFMASRTN